MSGAHPQQAARASQQRHGTAHHTRTTSTNSAFTSTSHHPARPLYSALRHRVTFFSAPSATRQFPWVL